MMSLTGTSAALAQDMRHIEEPRVPQACVMLQARLTAVDGVLSPEAERNLDTARIQRALDHCAAGKAVELRSNGSKQIFLSGPLTLRSGVTLVVAANTSLAASSDPRLYDITPGSCGILGTRGQGCKPLLRGEEISASGIMGEGSIDGRGGARISGENVTWWQLAHRAKVLDQYQKVPGLIELRHVRNFTLYRITLRDSAAHHVFIDDSDGVTAWGVKIMTPGTARNTDGINPVSSTNVTITHSYIHVGDDNIAISSRLGTAASHISITDNHFYSGHGMSIGSGTAGGVNHVMVRNLSIDGATNGIRIKSDPSRGGLVQEISYENVCIRNVANPIVLAPHYTDFSGELMPQYRDIKLRNVHVMTPGDYLLAGLDAQHVLGVTLDNVFAEDMENSHVIAEHADITLGLALGNLEPQGPNVTMRHAPESHPGVALPCAARFVPFPALNAAPRLEVTVPPIDKTLYVATDGTGDYYSIQRAIDVAPGGGAVISVAPGIYHEVLIIKKPHIELRSPYADASKTVVVAGKSSGTAGGTLNSATVNVLGDDFRAENISFVNDFNRTHPQLPQGSQAVALLVRGDREVFENVRILGDQDTLYAGVGECTAGGADRACPVARQYFDRCFIEGNVDFVFGDSKAVFDDCVIRSNEHFEGFITAQSKSYVGQDSGFVFRDCRLEAAPGVGNVYLGRPWRRYATVVYLNTWMDAQILPAGWREWHPGETDYLPTASYAEYHSSGPGAAPRRREPYARQLTRQQAQQYAPQVFLRGSDDWNPSAIRKGSR
ncbi:MAG TPA: pectinesterase family protein [Steroidobacteraceae bacterium]